MNYQKEIDNLKFKKDNLCKPIDDKIKELTIVMQQKCPHHNVEKTGGGMWHEWPDYGSYPYILKCLDCGLAGKSDDKDDNNYDVLCKGKIVKDVSFKRSGWNKSRY